MASRDEAVRMDSIDGRQVGHRTEYIQDGSRPNKDTLERGINYKRHETLLVRERSKRERGNTKIEHDTSDMRWDCRQPNQEVRHTMRQDYKLTSVPLSAKMYNLHEINNKMFSPVNC